ncbi:MAG: hypothetical protein IEMM0002_0094 [bacterium]|nr:MAG: hypothetical protein IEMM0002_0094 [bacterium]
MRTKHTKCLKENFSFKAMILYKLTGNRDAYKTYEMLKRKLQL